MFSVHLDPVVDRSITVALIGGKDLIDVRPINGTVVGPSGTAQDIFFDSDDFDVLDLDLDLRGNLLYGDYTVTLEDEAETFTAVYPLTDRSAKTYPLRLTVTPLTGLAHLVDGGSYPEGSTVSRDFTIERSSVPLFDADARKDTYRTYDNAEKNIAISYGNVFYSFFLAGEVRWVADDDGQIELRETFRSATITERVNAQHTLHSIADRAAAFIRSRIQVRNAFGTLDGGYTDQLVLLTNLMTLLYSAVYSQRGDIAEEVYRDVEDIIGSVEVPIAQAVRIGIDAAVGYPSSTSTDRVIGRGDAVTVRLDETFRYVVEASRKLDLLHRAVVERGGERIDLKLTHAPYVKLRLSDELGGAIDVPSFNPTIRARTLAGGTDVEIVGRLDITTKLLSDVRVKMLADPLPPEFTPRANTWFASVYDAEGRVVGSVSVDAAGNLILRGHIPLPPVVVTEPVTPTPTVPERDVLRDDLEVDPLDVGDGSTADPATDPTAEPVVVETPEEAPEPPTIYYYTFQLRYDPTMTIP